MEEEYEYYSHYWETRWFFESQELSRYITIKHLILLTTHESYFSPTPLRHDGAASQAFFYCMNVHKNSNTDTPLNFRTRKARKTPFVLGAANTDIQMGQRTVTECVYIIYMYVRMCMYIYGRDSLCRLDTAAYLRKYIGSMVISGGLLLVCVRLP